MTKRNSNFTKSRATYSVKHSINLVFDKIETVFFTFLCLVFLVTSKLNSNFSQNVSFSIISISMPVVKLAALPFNSVINLLSNFEELVNAREENEALKEEIEKFRSFYIQSLNIHSENKELKAALNFISLRSMNFKAANLIGRSHQVFGQKLFIDAGKNIGIKEGSIVTCEDEMGRDFFFKLKTPWYCERHGLLTEDLYREHIIIGYILDDKIDDILGQIPEDEKEAHIRINKIIDIVKKSISDKVSEIEKDYRQYVSMSISKKDYAINHRKNNPNFGFVMNMVKADDLKKMSKEEILDIYDNMEDYEKALQRCEPYEMAKMWLRDLTKRLNLSREWLQTKDKTLFFKDPEESDDN